MNKEGCKQIDHITSTNCALIVQIHGVVEGVNRVRTFEGCLQCVNLNRCYKCEFKYNSVFLEFGFILRSTDWFFNAPQKVQIFTFSKNCICFSLKLVVSWICLLINERLLFLSRASMFFRLNFPPLAVSVAALKMLGMKVRRSANRSVSSLNSVISLLCKSGRSSGSPERKLAW